MKTLHRFSLLCVVVICGCAVVPAPTVEEARAIGYGPEPTVEVLDQALKTFFQDRLIDPESARFSYRNRPKKEYMKETGIFGDHTLRTGWTFIVAVNAKNRLGGYVGAEDYEFLIKDGVIVGCRHGALPSWEWVGAPDLANRPIREARPSVTNAAVAVAPASPSPAPPAAVEQRSEPSPAPGQTVQVGMSAREVERVKGKPARIFTSVSRTMDREDWVYSNGDKITLDNGSVSAIQMTR